MKASILKKRVSLLTEGSLIKQIIIFVLPLIATSVTLQFFNTLDMAIAGQFIGNDALAAIGGTTSLCAFLIEFFIGFANTSNVVTAQFIGKKDPESANRSVHTSVLLSLSFGIFAGAAIFFAAEPILRLFSVPEDILEVSGTYIKFYALGLPFFMLYNFCAALFRSKGNTRLPMLCLVAGGILKLVLDLLFVTVFDMGVTGMAIATVFANMLSAFLLVLSMVMCKDELHLDFKKLKFDGAVTRILIKIGLPSGFLGSIFSISNLCTQTAINELGSEIIAATSAAIGIEIYIQFIGNAFSSAASTFMGQTYGAKEFKRLNKIALSTLGICLSVSLVLSVGAFIFADSLLKLFVTDAAIISFAIIRMKYTLLFKPLQAVMDITTGYLQGYGYTLVPAIISVFAVCGVRLLWIFFVFEQNKSLDTLMLIYPITQGFSAISNIICYLILQRRIKKRGNISRK